jgi:hypothetical protein
MIYSNFDDNITAKWRLVIEGWPLKRFCNPSDISTRNEVQLLMHAWQSGTAHFWRLDDEEWEAWQTARIKAVLDEMVEYHGRENDGEPVLHNMPDDPEPTHLNQPHPSTPPAHNPSLPDENTSPAQVDGPQAGSSTASKRPSQGDLPDPKRRKSVPLGGSQFVNTVTAADGTTVVATTKKPRKPRSDKGKARGPRRAKTHIPAIAGA